jgi:hypothetical protein
MLHHSDLFPARITGSPLGFCLVAYRCLVETETCHTPARPLLCCAFVLGAIWQQFARAHREARSYQPAHIPMQAQHAHDTISYICVSDSFRQGCLGLGL